MHERQVQLYDTTLRDGMQQEGMSVSVDEKVRIALKLDELGIGFIEGGFPASNPKEIEFFRRMQRRAAGERGARRLRHDPAQGRAGRGRRQPARAGRDLHAHGRHRRQDVGPAPQQGHPREPRREPAHDRRVGALPRGAGQARGVRRRALLRRLARRPRVRAALRDRGRRGGRRGRLPVRHQRGVACRRSSRTSSARSRRRCPSASSASTSHNDSDCAVASSLVAVEAGAASGAGHRQRLRRALRQRQPRQHHPGAQAQDGPATW